MYIWEEGEDKWIWPADESVPRYVGSQISRDEVVSILNKSEAQQAEIDELMRMLDKTTDAGIMCIGKAMFDENKALIAKHKGE